MPLRFVEPGPAVVLSHLVKLKRSHKYNFCLWFWLLKGCRPPKHIWSVPITLRYTSLTKPQPFNFEDQCIAWQSKGNCHKLSKTPFTARSAWTRAWKITLDWTIALLWLTQQHPCTKFHAVHVKLLNLRSHSMTGMTWEAVLEWDWGDHEKIIYSYQTSTQWPTPIQEDITLPRLLRCSQLCAAGYLCMVLGTSSPPQRCSAFVRKSLQLRTCCEMYCCASLRGLLADHTAEECRHTTGGTGIVYKDIKGASLHTSVLLANIMHWRVRCCLCTLAWGTWELCSRYVWTCISQCMWGLSCSQVRFSRSKEPCGGFSRLDVLFQEFCAGKWICRRNS